MSLFSLVFALLLEQLRPLSYQRVVRSRLLLLADWLEKRFNAGHRQHEVLAWCFSVVGVSLLSGIIFFALHQFSPFLAWCWNVLMLYLTLGFRQFSHYYTDIQFALRMGDLAQARQHLAAWRGRAADELSSTEVARLAIEEALTASHRHVFGVLVGFVLLPGPCGAVLYRMAAFFAEYWGSRSQTRQADGVDSVLLRGVQAGVQDNLQVEAQGISDFGLFSRQAFALIDYLPLRITAAGFAIVGNFEDAVYCWRTQAATWFDAGIGIVLASGAGALGVRLGMPVLDHGELADRAELGTGAEADVDFMQSAIGLVWRALLLWLIVLLFFGFAHFLSV
ncbi:MAG: cobalamin biosynthesis protein [Pseudomonadota bacterium]